jgi:hypothetical protein
MSYFKSRWLFGLLVGLLVLPILGTVTGCAPHSTPEDVAAARRSIGPIPPGGPPVPNFGTPPAARYGAAPHAAPSRKG